MSLISTSEQVSRSNTSWTCYHPRLPTNRELSPPIWQITPKINFKVLTLLKNQTKRSIKQFKRVLSSEMAFILCSDHFTLPLSFGLTLFEVSSIQQIVVVTGWLFVCIHPWWFDISVWYLVHSFFHFLHQNIAILSQNDKYMHKSCTKLHDWDL